jgi:integrase
MVCFNSASLARFRGSLRPRGSGRLGASSTRAKLSQRELLTDEDDLVLTGPAGGFLDGSLLRRRYKAALKEVQLRSLRFHDLRHTVGTRMIAKADIRRVQEWMGHADIQTTMRYLHYVPREEDARLVAEAFEVKAPDPLATGTVQA